MWIEFCKDSRRNLLILPTVLFILQQIQIRHQVCGGPYRTCNCGVMVREGNYVLGVSDCNRPKVKNSFKPLMFEQVISDDPDAEPPNGAGLYRSRDGRRFAVSMQNVEIS